MTRDQRTQVAHLATYITDDGAIASYVGVPREDVIAVRRNTVKATPQRFLAKRSEPIGMSAGMEATRYTDMAAEAGSTALLRAIVRAFGTHANKRRISLVAAANELLNDRRAA